MTFNLLACVIISFQIPSRSDDFILRTASQKFNYYNRLSIRIFCYVVDITKNCGGWGLKFTVFGLPPALNRRARVGDRRRLRAVVCLDFFWIVEFWLLKALVDTLVDVSNLLFQLAKFNHTEWGPLEPFPSYNTSTEKGGYAVSGVLYVSNHLELETYIWPPIDLFLVSLERLPKMACLTLLKEGSVARNLKIKTPQL